MGTRALICLPCVMLHRHTHISSAVQALSLSLFPQVLGEDLLASGRKKTTAHVHRPQGSKSRFFFFLAGGGLPRADPDVTGNLSSRIGTSSFDLSPAPCLDPAGLLNRIQCCSRGARNQGDAGRTGRRAAEGLYRH